MLADKSNILYNPILASILETKNPAATKPSEKDEATMPIVLSE